VPQAEKHRRVNTLLDISEQKLHDFYTAHVGQTRPVLFEESDIAGSIGGFTDNYIRVEIPYDPSLANQIVPVELKTDIFDS
ncbi:MAG: tRNA (N(6)-L-threonylcarbamoyladenosine(37)-C(2))-methylthiotransferase MtaB, partial [Butyricimonas sp.]|nr:tRNA (N(6)-L-threonylcarbamoyladenosine(37)-C(2))-methylthiotransferase MtaB [Butyricimonas sp.]